jgi:hypothetical protein
MIPPSEIHFFAQVAVCKYSIGSVIKCISLISSSCTAIYGETLAALLVARLAMTLGLSSFILKSDSLNVTLTLQQPAITQIGELLPLFLIFTLSFHQQLIGKLVKLIKVQTFVPIMWQIGLQPESILVAFSYFSLYLFLFLHV